MSQHRSGWSSGTFPVHGAMQMEEGDLAKLLLPMTVREAVLWAGCSSYVHKPKEQHHFQIVKCSFLAHSAPDRTVKSSHCNPEVYTAYR